MDSASDFIRHLEVNMYGFCFNMILCMKTKLKKNTTEFSVSKYCLILEGRVVVAI